MVTPSTPPLTCLSQQEIMVSTQSREKAEKQIKAMALQVDEIYQNIMEVLKQLAHAFKANTDSSSEETECKMGLSLPRQPESIQKELSDVAHQIDGLYEIVNSLSTMEKQRASAGLSVAALKHGQLASINDATDSLANATVPTGDGRSRMQRRAFSRAKSRGQRRASGSSASLSQAHTPSLKSNPSRGLQSKSFKAVTLEKGKRQGAITACAACVLAASLIGPLAFVLRLRPTRHVA